MGSEGKSTKNIVVLGSEGVGKSSLCIRYTQGHFPDEHMPTQCVDTYQKWVTLDKRTNTSNVFGKSMKRIMLKITDTAGQEEMVSLLDRHLEGQDAVLLVLSLSDAKSLERGVSAYERACRAIPRSADASRIQPIVIVCNKSDLINTDPNLIQFNKEEIMKVLSNVNEKQIVYTSAKNDDNVQEAFTRAIQLMGNQKGSGTCRVM